MSLNSKQKPHCQLVSAELFPNETGKQQKMTKARLCRMPYISGSQFIQQLDALFLSLMVTNCSGERSFSRFKRMKNELQSRNVPG